MIGKNAQIAKTHEQDTIRFELIFFHDISVKPSTKGKFPMFFSTNNLCEQKMLQ